MAFFKEQDPVKSANLELHNRLMTFIKHATYNTFKDRIEEGETINQDDINNLAEQIHPPILEVSSMGINSIKRTIIEYISEEWGLEAYGIDSICKKQKELTDESVKKYLKKLNRMK